MTGWDLLPGRRLSRADLHEAYGGRQQGRISPSIQTANVMLFLGDATPEHPFDGWADGAFQFTGGL